VAKPNPRKSRGSTPARPRRTAVRRSRPRPGRRQGRSGPLRKLLGTLDRRPWVLAALAVGLLVVGVMIGLALRGDGTGPATAEVQPLPQRPARMLANPPVPPDPPPVTYETDYGPAFVAPEPLRAPERAPAADQEETVARPGPGVRLTDPPENQAAAPHRPAPETDANSVAGEEHPLWLRNAVAPPPVGDRPMIAVVIDDMGIDRRRSSKIVDLPGPITTSYLTYARDLGSQLRAARAAGHELLIHVPMEPSSTAVDPGPDVLKTSMTPADVAATLTKVLDRADGYVGINNHMGSRFTATDHGMRPVMEVLKARGLLWFDSRTTADSVGARLAREADVPYVERNVFLDHEETPEFVAKQLASLERIARKHGYAVAIGHPKDVTIAGLKKWLPTLKEKGFVLVPLSTVVRRRHGTG